MRERLSRRERKLVRAWGIGIAVIGVVLAGGMHHFVTADLSPAVTVGDGDSERRYTLPDANISTEVRPSGELSVEEAITFDFEGTFRGAYRDIKLLPGEVVREVSVRDERTRYSPGASTVLGGFGIPATFGTELLTSPLTERVVWYHASSNERRTFHVSYLFDNVTKIRGDLAEINLQVWGSEWDTGPRDLVAVFTIPEGPGEVTAWAHSQLADAKATVSGSRVVLRASDIPARHFVELRVVFPASRLDDNPRFAVDRKPVTIDEVRSEEQDIARDLTSRQNDHEFVQRAALALAGLAVVLAILPGVALVHMFRRTFWREIHAIDHAGDGQVVAEPPSDLEPAIAACLVDQRTEAPSDALTATVFELVRKDCFKVVPAEGEGPGAQTDIALLAADGDIPELSAIEEPVYTLLSQIIAKRPEGVPLSELDDVVRSNKKLARTVYSKSNQFKKQVTSRMAASGWLKRGTLWPVWIIVCVLPLVAAAALAASILELAAFEYLHVVIFGITAISAFGTLLVIAASLTIPRLSWRYSATGIAEAQGWVAFRDYLERMADMQDEQTASLPLWERYLVYGIAFGCAEGILRSVKPDVRDANVESTRASNYLHLLQSTDYSSFSTMGSVFASAGAPRSSSSGGGGGGSFGGGSGGGGGGAW